MDFALSDAYPSKKPNITTEIETQILDFEEAKESNPNLNFQGSMWDDTVITLIVAGWRPTAKEYSKTTEEIKKVGFSSKNTG